MACLRLFDHIHDYIPMFIVLSSPPHPYGMTSLIYVRSPKFYDKPFEFKSSAREQEDLSCDLKHKRSIAVYLSIKTKGPEVTAHLLIDNRELKMSLN